MTGGWGVGGGSGCTRAGKQPAWRDTLRAGKRQRSVQIPIAAPPLDPSHLCPGPHQVLFMFEPAPRRVSKPCFQPAVSRACHHARRPQPGGGRCAAAPAALSRPCNSPFYCAP